MGKPEVSIVVLNWNGKSHLSNCLKAIKMYTKVPYEAIVVDNVSKDGSVEMLKREFKWVKLIENKTNLGVPVSTNKGFRIAKGRFIVTLGNDTVVTKNWLEPCIDHLESSDDIACVGITLCEPHLMDKIIPENKFRYRDAVCSQGMIFKREILDKVGYYDEKNFNPIGGEEVDWQYRIINAGYKIIETRKSIISHIGGADSSPQNPNRQFLLNYGRMKAILYNDSPISFFKRVPGLLLTLLTSIQEKTTKTVLRSYFAPFKDIDNILTERKRRSMALLRRRHLTS